MRTDDLQWKCSSYWLISLWKHFTIDNLRMGRNWATCYKWIIGYQYIYHIIIKWYCHISAFSWIGWRSMFKIRPDVEMCASFEMKSMKLRLQLHLNQFDINWILHDKICIICCIKLRLLYDPKGHRPAGWYWSRVDTTCDTDLTCNVHYIIYINHASSMVCEGVRYKVWQYRSSGEL